MAETIKHIIITLSIGELTRVERGSIIFDVNYYKNAYADLKQAYGGNNQAYYNHFINYGMNEGRAGSMFLDVNFYKSKYGDLSQAFGNNKKAYYEHFVKYGMAEGRQASASFDVKYYLSQYGDLQKAYGNNYTEAIKHYIYYGKNEGRKCAATANNGGNGNNQPNTPPTNTEYTPTPNENGIKIIPQKEIAKYISKIPITTENWQDYMELEDYETVDKNVWGDIQFISKGTHLKLKNDSIYTTSVLEFEITNPELMNPYSDKTISTCEFPGYSLYPINNIWVSKEQEPNTNIYDYRFTINDIKCTRTKGNVYIFNIPDNFWTIRSSGNGKDLYIENLENKYGQGYEYYYEGVYATKNSWTQNLGKDIENGIFKDINL